MGRKINKICKIIFTIVAIVFLYFFLTVPKTDCQSCEFPYLGDTIDGNEAFRMIEEACISYDKPWDTPEFNVTLNETFK